MMKLALHVVYTVCLIAVCLKGTGGEIAHPSVTATLAHYSTGIPVQIRIKTFTCFAGSYAFLATCERRECRLWCLPLIKLPLAKDDNKIGNERPDL